MRVYIDGKELNPRLKIFHHVDIEEMKFGKIYYFAFGNEIWENVQSMMFIYKGWNSLHFIKYLESI